eukprot:CAMPEP_0198284262 /NCGR_PEP_ID=MMETSP1449-20131203/3758_1 /TAXON_ID=420275 /ORGANISM="Attheya septentrionalis, Strain CCMP2084" /LENGTH=339 /DNA_ID=CAMNT_0043981253 /DNA_START=236 /DNA_END=1255 /DNA_ORIENTATION=+
MMGLSADSGSCRKKMGPSSYLRSHYCHMIGCLFPVMILIHCGVDVAAFAPSSSCVITSQANGPRTLTTGRAPVESLAAVSHEKNEFDELEEQHSTRRWLLSQMAKLATTCATVGVVGTPAAFADDIMTGVDVSSVALKEFIDPLGLFSVKVPKEFFTLRRSAKGDLPDAKTGQGRRGSSIFTAGNMAKAEVVAIERFPVTVLLEEAGLIVKEGEDLSTFSRIGKPEAIANLINMRREKDKTKQTKTELVSASFPSPKELIFELKTEIDVQKPELLMEQYGVDRLFRITVAKATLDSNDGNLMAVFASALEQDFKSPDGVALRQTVDSFLATDQSTNIAP